MEKYSHLDLHPESVAYLKYIQEHSNPSLQTVEEKRVERNKRYAYTTYTAREFALERIELVVPSPDVPDGIPVYVYTPAQLPADPAFLVYFHGGGAVLGCRAMVDSVCKILAQDAECVVLNVEYRLAPEYPAPAQMDDGCAVVRWLRQNIQQLGGTEKSLIGVGGDSAGARISASVAHDVPVDFEVLMYPNVSSASKKPVGSLEKYKDGPILTLKLSKWFAELAIPKGEEDNPRIASELRPSFRHLPPTLIIVAEHDKLSDSGTGYAETLRKSGVEVECEIYKGAIHGFFPYIRMYPELAGRAHAQVADFIKKLKQRKDSS